MVSSKIEWHFLRLLLGKPELHVYGFKPADPLVCWVHDALQGYLKRYGRYPNMATLLESLPNTAGGDQQLAYAKEQLTDTSLDDGFVEDSILTLVEKQRLGRAVQEAGSFLRQDDLSKAKEVLSNGLLGVYHSSRSVYATRPKSYSYGVIPTGYSRIDKAIKGGGLGRRLLGVVMGPRGSHKSTVLMNMGVNASLEGHKVLHLTLEDSQDNVIDRYQKRLGKFQKQEGLGDIIVQELYTCLSTVLDCAGCVAAFKPDLVLVDYIDVLAAYSKDAKRFELGAVTGGLRALAQQYNCSVWAGKQTGKHTKFSSEDVKAEDSAEASVVAQIVDVAITLNQTKEDKQNKRLTFILDKNKDGIEGVRVPTTIDYARMSIREDPS